MGHRWNPRWRISGMADMGEVSECRNGHVSEREFIAGHMRCRECYREGNRIRHQQRRAREKGVTIADPRSPCPKCGLIPCQCEEL